MSHDLGSGDRPPGRFVTTPAASPEATVPSAARRHVTRRRLTLLGLSIVLVLGGAFIAYAMYQDSLLYVSTDSAQLWGQQMQVGSLSAGRVVAIAPAIGTRVRKGDLLAQVAVPSQIGTHQNGSAKLAFLGDADSRVDVRAPIDGLVIAAPASVGDTVAAGQAIVTLVDPARLWVTANVDETKIGQVQVGQPADVHVDALDMTLPGRVEVVTPATASSFSLLPAMGSPGSKTTQVVPVRIRMSLAQQPALLGASAEVKIHVAETP